MTYTELCKEKRVQIKFRGINRNWCILHDRPLFETIPPLCDRCEEDKSCIPSFVPLLSDLWQWWMKLVGKELCDGKWKRSLCHLYNTTDILLKDCDTIEHALLACILEALDKEKKA